MSPGLFDNLPPRPSRPPVPASPAEPAPRKIDTPAATNVAQPQAAQPTAVPDTPDKPESPAAPDAPLSVTDLAVRVKDALARGLPKTVRVVGEVSGLRDRTHWFFDLKDDKAVVRCVMFADAARRVGFRVRDGLEVVACGRVDYFGGQGRLQVYVNRLEPVGQGALQAEFERLAAELRDQGLFDPARKRRLPAYPRKLAVVTSRSAAAWRDVIDTARQRHPGVELLHLDVRVQGGPASGEIARALDRLSQRGEALGIDAVLLVRGGGSLEDLWAFNTREVAEAVARCALPVVAGVGHETDVTLAQLCADVGAATPTQAAMAAVPDRGELGQQVEHLASRLSMTLRRRADSAGHRLHRAERSAVLRNPGGWVAPRRLAVDRAAARLAQSLPARVTLANARAIPIQTRLDAALRARLQRRQAQTQAIEDRARRAAHERVRAARAKLASVAARLDAVGPAAVLRRGFTYTTDGSGRLLRSAEQARQTGMLVTRFADGQVASEVRTAADPPAQD
ncbi:MAG: exodeoxyribonuclease VII large subunit [Planctomycetota bacterium]